MCFWAYLNFVMYVCEQTKRTLASLVQALGAESPTCSEEGEGLARLREASWAVRALGRRLGGVCRMATACQGQALPGGPVTLLI